MEKEEEDVLWAVLLSPSLVGCLHIPVGVGGGKAKCPGH